MGDSEIVAAVKNHYANANRTTDPADSAGSAHLPQAGIPMAALADLRPGETVLELACGDGIDVLLSAQRVGPQGRAYGIDAADDMRALAEENRFRAGARNAVFLCADMENIPLPSASVDVVIANHGINMSADTARVLEEAFRVLRPGGRFALADVAATNAANERVLPPDAATAAAVAATPAGYRVRLESAGFEAVSVLPVDTAVVEADSTTPRSPGDSVIQVHAKAAAHIAAAVLRARKPG